MTSPKPLAGVLFAGKSKRVHRPGLATSCSRRTDMRRLLSRILSCHLSYEAHRVWTASTSACQAEVCSINAVKLRHLRCSSHPSHAAWRRRSRSPFSSSRYRTFNSLLHELHMPVRRAALCPLHVVSFRHCCSSSFSFCSRQLFQLDCRDCLGLCMRGLRCEGC